jgi:hypothetical protein
MSTTAETLRSWEALRTCIVRGMITGGLIALVLVGQFSGGHVRNTVAQEGTPSANASAMPSGVSFEGLAFAQADALPPGPFELNLFRATLEPGAKNVLGPDPSYFLILMESGAMTFRVDAPGWVTRAVAGTPAAQMPSPAAAEEIAAGTEVTLGPGDVGLFAPNPNGADGEARNDGQEPAMALAVSVGPAGTGPEYATPAP